MKLARLLRLPIPLALFACVSAGSTPIGPANDSEAGASGDGSSASSTHAGAAGDGATDSGKGGGESGANGGAEGGTDGDSADGTEGPGSYALNPPKQCDNQFFVTGCTAGDTSTTCGGTCSAQSACEGAKPNNPDIGFLCPRFILSGKEMTEAAEDDWGASSPFHYAIVGHDPDDTLDPNGTSATRTCCQCYQLVFAVPNEAEAQVAGQSSGASAVVVPPPLVVQAFNTSAGGGKNFDVFMGAGGFGAFNACDPNFTEQPSPSGEYLYTHFTEVGEGGNGGEKAALLTTCDTNENLITSATLSSSGCQSQVASDCNEIAAANATVTDETIQSCIASNDPNTFYHLNWQVYAKKIECPNHLMEVTGCELSPENLPAANPNVTTAAEAAADPTFAAGYTTTTMQDCCKPTCAWQDNVSNTKNAGANMGTVGEYNSFYSCDQSGDPVTE
jgi:hypothetical protein